MKSDTISTFLSITAIHFCHSKWRPPYGSIQTYANVMSQQKSLYSRQVGWSSAEHRFDKTVSPLTHSHAEVVVLASVCHDSVMVGLCAQVCWLNLFATVLSCYSCDFVGQCGWVIIKVIARLPWIYCKNKQTSSSGYALGLGLLLS